MKLKYTFAVNEVADQFVAVAVGGGIDNFNGFIKMNDIGAEIFELLNNDITLEEIIAEMLKNHPESNEEEAKETVSGFVETLKVKGIVE